MVKRSVFTRIFFRSNKKPDQIRASNSPEVITTTENLPTLASSTSSKSNSNKNRDQGIDPILWVSPKQHHLLSLLKYANADNDPFEIPNSQQPNFYSLRLYLATVQKLKCYKPTTMEKQRAVYHILSRLVIQQELDRFEPAFEPMGRKPRKTRYISTLLDTPVESILSYHHPVLEASKRKPFVETFDVIIPSPLSPSSSCSLSSSSSSTLSVATSYTSPPYNCKQYVSSHPTPPATLIQSSCSDPSFHSPTSDSTPFKRKTNFSSISNDDDDNIPLAILKTRKKLHSRIQIELVL